MDYSGYRQDFLKNMEELSDQKKKIISLLDSLRVEELERKYKGIDFFGKEMEKRLKPEYKNLKRAGEDIKKTYNLLEYAAENGSVDSKELASDSIKLQELERELIGSDFEFQSSLLTVKNSVKAIKKLRDKQIKYFKKSAESREKEYGVTDKIDELKDDISKIRSMVCNNELEKALKELNRFYSKEMTYLNKFNECFQKVTETYDVQIRNAEEKRKEVKNVYEDQLKKLKTEDKVISFVLKDNKDSLGKIKSKYFKARYFAPFYKLGRRIKNQTD